MKEWFKELAYKLGGRCPYCGMWLMYSVEYRRLPTSYQDEECNWITSCDFCYEEAYTAYADLINEMYRYW